MKSHHRMSIFCAVILLDPALFALGEWAGGLGGGVLLPGVATLASLLYAWLGEGGEPPLGTGLS